MLILDVEISTELKYKNFQNFPTLHENINPLHIEKFLLTCTRTTACFVQFVDAFINVCSSFRNTYALYYFESF